MTGRRALIPASAGSTGAIAVAVAALLYVLVRVGTVGPTYDEVSTLFYFVPASLGKIYTAHDSNSHLLNTLLIKTLFASGHQSLAVARLPNLCAFAAYLFFGVRLARRFASGLLTISLVALLVANPFLLDFFGLARGYGIALGAQLASLYYLVSFPTTSRPTRAMALSLLAAALAVLAALPWLHYYVAVAGAGTALAILYRRPIALQIAGITGAISAALAVVVFVPIRELQRNHALFYGGHRDFYHDTLMSLAKYAAYSPAVTRGVVVALDVVLVALVGALGAAYLRRGAGRSAALLAVAGLLGLSAASSIAQHYLLGAPYLIDRTALFLYPSGAVALCLALAAALGPRWGSRAAAIVAAAATVNLVMHANVRKTAMWFFDAHSREILQAINDTGVRTGQVQRLEFAWPFEQSVRYEEAHGAFPYVKIVRPLDPVDQNDFNPDANYYIHLGVPLENFDYDPTAQKALTRAHGTTMCFRAESTCVYRLE